MCVLQFHHLERTRERNISNGKKRVLFFCKINEIVTLEYVRYMPQTGFDSSLLENNFPHSTRLMRVNETVQTIDFFIYKY
jgi:hypothetical protein